MWRGGSHTGKVGVGNVWIAISEGMAEDNASSIKANMLRRGQYQILMAKENEMGEL